MLLMQEPELLLVDEPVAGMTPQEIERTAALLQSLAGEHSVVVVEHDMDFVRSIAKRVTVLHEGRVFAEGDMERGTEGSPCHRSLSRRVGVLAVKGFNQFYGGSHTLWDVDLNVSAGSLHVRDGPQRHGQDDPAEMHHGAVAGAASGSITFEGADLLGVPPRTRARIGIGYVPQGREIFSHLTVEENLRIGLGVRKNGLRSIPQRSL